MASLVGTILIPVAIFVAGCFAKRAMVASSCFLVGRLSHFLSCQGGGRGGNTWNTLGHCPPAAPAICQVDRRTPRARCGVQRMQQGTLLAVACHVAADHEPTTQHKKQGGQASRPTPPPAC